MLTRVYVNIGNSIADFMDASFAFFETIAKLRSFCSACTKREGGF